MFCHTNLSASKGCECGPQHISARSYFSLKIKSFMIDASKGKVVNFFKTAIWICTVPFLNTGCSHTATESPCKGHYTQIFGLRTGQTSSSASPPHWSITFI